jgi:hypothetical protein
MTKYYCKYCGKILDRDSDKQWVKSYCDTADRTVYLQKVMAEPKPDLHNTKSVSDGSK